MLTNHKPSDKNQTNLHNYQISCFAYTKSFCTQNITIPRHFDDFNDTMTNYYGSDFSCMRGEFLEEQRK
jgi:hypothetical protein